MFNAFHFEDELRGVGVGESQARVIAGGFQKAAEAGKVASHENFARLEERMKSLETMIKFVSAFFAALLIPIFLKTFFG